MAEITNQKNITIEKPELSPDKREEKLERISDLGQFEKFTAQPAADLAKQTIAKASVLDFKPAAEVKDLKLQQVEDILAEDLDEIYQQLPAEKRREFKMKGEEAANKIVVLISQIKFKFSEIWEIIRSWLKLIPGVNKFFIEQEAKLKTDKIINLYRLDQNKK